MHRPGPPAPFVPREGATAHAAARAAARVCLAVRWHANPRADRKPLLWLAPVRRSMAREEGGADFPPALPGASSWAQEGEWFVKGSIAVSATGVIKRDSGKAFVVDPEQLDFYDVIGRGASSFVQRAIHRPTGTRLALKVMNVFDRTKRDQLVKEIRTLYDADCEWSVAVAGGHVRRTGRDRYVGGKEKKSKADLPLFLRVCERSLIGFFGAFYREGAITIALDYMDGGSLSNVVHQMGPIPEPALASIAFQALWGLAYMKHERRLHRVRCGSDRAIGRPFCVLVVCMRIGASPLRRVARLRRRRRHHHRRTPASSSSRLHRRRTSSRRTF